MITYQDLVDQILIESGQWLPGLEATMLNKPQIDSMIRRELQVYSRYLPREITRRGKLHNGYTFTKEVDGVIPKNITRINANNFPYSGFFPYSTIPVSLHNFNWKYENGTLYMRHPEGIYDYSFITDHKYENDQIDSLSANDNLFIDLLVGRFMMSLGRSRRAFVLNDLSFNTDADSMYSEGKELYDTTLEFIKEHSAFHLAIIV